jgi:hypothetical protein
VYSLSIPFENCQQSNVAVELYTCAWDISCLLLGLDTAILTWGLSDPSLKRLGKPSIRP